MSFMPPRPWQWPEECYLWFVLAHMPARLCLGSGWFLIHYKWHS